MVCRYDLNGGVVGWNLSLASLLNYTPNKMLDKPQAVCKFVGTYAMILVVLAGVASSNLFLENK